MKVFSDDNFLVVQEPGIVATSARVEAMSLNLIIRPSILMNAAIT